MTYSQCHCGSATISHVINQVGAAVNTTTNNVYLPSFP